MTLLKRDAYLLPMEQDPAATGEIRRFEQQYRNNPDSLVFARLADAYRKSGDPERALALLDEGIGRHRDYPSAHIVRARALVDLERHGAAEDAFLRVLELDTTNLVAMRGLAALARERGDLAAARAWFQRISGLDAAAPETEPSVEISGTSDAESLPPPAGEFWTPDTPVADLPSEPDEQSPATPSGAWWFEDPGDAASADDGDLLTRTMAELYQKQGLHREAAAIYRELLADRPDDADLREALADLEERLDEEPPALEEAEAVETVARTKPRWQPEARSDAPTAPVQPSSGTSDVFLEWLKRLRE